MEKLVRVLRNMSIKKRIIFAFISLCVFPVCLVILVNTVLEIFYFNQNLRKHYDNFAYESEARISDAFEQFSKKFEYLKENNDILTDLYLYENNEGYHTDEVKKRIADTIASIISTQEEIEYTIIILKDEASFSYGRTTIDMSKISKLGRDKAEWHHFQYENKEILCIVQQVQIHYNNKQSATFVIFISLDDLDQLCETASGSSKQSISILDDKNRVMAGETVETDKVAYVVKNPIMDTGFTIRSSFQRESLIWNSFLTTILLAVSVLLGALLILFLLQESIAIPLEHLLQRIKMTYENESIILIEEEKSLMGAKDEHAILNREFNAMLIRLNELIEDVYQTKIHEAELKTRIKELELTALQQQINPHFFYNILDNIFWIAQMQGYEEISEMISALGEFFKTSVSEKGAYVTIQTEIKNVKSYVLLQKIMHKDQFTDHWHIEPDILDCKTVKLILQPVIENCIVHGLAEVDTGGEISIIGRRNRGEIEFIIRDNGKGMTQEECNELKAYMNSEVNDVKGSIGMKNVNQRIKIYFGKEYGIDINSKIGVGTVVFITIPIKE